MSKLSQKQEQLKKINELEKEKNKLLGQVESLSLQIATNKTEHEEVIKKLNSENEASKTLLVTAHQDEALKKDQSYKQESDELKSKVVSLEENEKKQNQIVKNQQKQLNEHELKKMAEAYHKQEFAYESDAKFWMKAIAWVVGALIVSTVVSIILANGKPWYDRFEFYLVDFIFISAVWFCSSQYSYYVHLRADYANRKTVAQSYHNILLSMSNENSEVENKISDELKNKFVEKAADVLYAQNFSNIKEPLLTKEFVKNIAEVAKTITTK